MLNVPWPPLASGYEWGIGYEVGSNGLINKVCESMYVPSGGQTYSYCTSIPSQYSNYWYNFNVVWAGAGGGSVYFNPGGSGQFLYISNVVLYQGPLADNTGENSNVSYTQMYILPPILWILYQLYQNFQT